MPGNARSGIDVQLTKRHDLVPNLARAVAAYAEHEREALRLVMDASKDAMAKLGAPASAEAPLGQYAETGRLGASAPAPGDKPFRSTLVAAAGGKYTGMRENLAEMRGP